MSNVNIPQMPVQVDYDADNSPRQLEDTPQWSLLRRWSPTVVGLFGMTIMLAALGLDVDRMRVAMDSGSTLVMGALITYIGGASAERVGGWFANRWQK